MVQLEQFLADMPFCLSMDRDKVSQSDVMEQLSVQTGNM